MVQIQHLSKLIIRTKSLHILGMTDIETVDDEGYQEFKGDWESKSMFNWAEMKSLSLTSMKMLEVESQPEEEDYNYQSFVQHQDVKWEGVIDEYWGSQVFRHTIDKNRFICPSKDIKYNSQDLKGEEFHIKIYDTQRNMNQIVIKSDFSSYYQPGNPNNQVEIVLYAKNTSTYEEYTFKTTYNQEYVDKLQKWISKKRYTCKPVIASNKINLQAQDSVEYLHLVIKIFTFTLKKVSRNDMDILKDEFKVLKEQDIQLQKEMRLFNYQFFNQNEINRRKMDYLLSGTLGDNYRAKIVDSIENLYDKYEGVGYQQEEAMNHAGAGISSQYSGGNMGMGMMNKQSKQMEAIIIGNDLNQIEGRDAQGNGGYANKMSIIQLGKYQMSPMQLLDKHSGLMTSYYAYEIDRQVKHHEKYEIMISRLQKAL
ncbi:UNKNOWN [Stylonychia lemnae]|uniref:Uncharacterized protein n=1 Tax=Stylonychia lemnae TaxID=5949 RepID=A0A078B4J1_STYLE|nr:UNKNOWN [Stylonychia lemnae]|eukprot:CDW88142.1 UNKNOWN [Stylonychia lemnae]